MELKQRKAVYMNGRLNYLIDIGTDAATIHKELKRLNIGFINRIIEKRKANGFTKK